MKERCLILIKPDGISRGLVPHILERIRYADLDIVDKRFLTATAEQCREHYNVKARNYGATEEQIVQYLARSYIKNENVCAVVVEGEDAVAKAYKVKMEIRNNFGTDTREKCTAEGRALHNVIHSSETIEDAEKEIEVWLERQFSAI